MGVMGIMGIMGFMGVMGFMGIMGVMVLPASVMLRSLANNTPIALTLMIAESRTEEKDVMVKAVVNLINHKN